MYILFSTGALQLLLVVSVYFGGLKYTFTEINELPAPGVKVKLPICPVV